ncbi:zinc finger BED domain-containing protein 1-like [Fundulus heteroclitus]|uniref:zinc finger BED domain-containing protein 1-like n=1 Tax=Fundulus heteroclitus TaxID=8078 RepID=UPI00165AB501|nr:zinc finger BED domain-containing protein 1-like [Fundulus heteroclitus]
MLEHFLEQQPAISATLLSQDVRRNEKDLCTLTEEDVTTAEDLVWVLKPMKEATLVMSEDKQPTLSVIAPLLALLQDAFTPSLEDSAVVRDLKAAVKNNLGTRYDGQKDTLYAASVLDPRFKALPFLSASDQNDTFSRLQAEAATAARDQDGGNDTDKEAEDTLPKKPKKSSTLESLLGTVYSTTVKDQGLKTPAIRAEDEVRRYKAENPAGLNENPLIWWKLNKREYPLLARLARHYLCVPGTSIASERVFSTAGDIVTAKRSCLSTDHVNELIFLHKNLTINEK